eukprot:3244384-Amphidinium_carterae.1
MSEFLNSHSGPALRQFSSDTTLARGKENSLASLQKGNMAANTSNEEYLPQPRDYKALKGGSKERTHSTEHSKQHHTRPSIFPLLSCWIQPSHIVS